ncbi:hypothetical protein ACIQ7Q_24345 [Streptomyces sp. NPDC096176]
MNDINKLHALLYCLLISLIVGLSVVLFVVHQGGNMMIVLHHVYET